jgi:t-SNARE complex subunit (syntaxin)
VIEEGYFMQALKAVFLLFISLLITQQAYTQSAFGQMDVIKKNFQALQTQIEDLKSLNKKQLDTVSKTLQQQMAALSKNIQSQIKQVQSQVEKDIASQSKNQIGQLKKSQSDMYSNLKKEQDSMQWQITQLQQQVASLSKAK